MEVLNKIVPYQTQVVGHRFLWEQTLKNVTLEEQFWFGLHSQVSDLQQGP